MKAFGVRLAAGAVTILLGAIMAAQAQKDQQANTDSAWTEERIPPGKTVPPVGTAAALLSADPMHVEALKPIEEDVAGSAEAESASQPVRLVQHTESADDSAPGVMGMPSVPDETEENSNQPESASKQSITKMRLPSFDDAFTAESNAGASDTGASDAAASVEAAANGQSDSGPSLIMGMPIADSSAGDASGGDASAASVASSSKLSKVRFADTPSSADSGQRGSEPTEAGDLGAGRAPANDLRVGGSFGMDAAAAPEGRASGYETFGGGSQTPEAFAAGPSLSDVGQPTAAAPAGMLTPVMPDDATGGQPELAEAPGTTMRIHREPPVQLQIKANDAALFGANDEPSRSPSTPSTLGITSRPQIVGENGASLATGAPYDQSGMTAGAGGYTQPTGGFGVPDNYPASAAANALPAPPLPPPSRPASAFEAPPIGSQANASQQRFGQLPTAAASAPAMGMGAGAPNYQGVSQQRRGDAALSAGSSSGGSTMALPGERHLDGPQAPSLVIEKRAPAEVKVGKPASFVITIRNVGRSKALDVQVQDRVPTGMTLTDATPRPNPEYQPELVWELGDMEPGQERTITLQLTPEQEGELGSVARVTYQAAASVRTVSTRPRLKIVQKAPEKVLIGQQLEIELEVSNPGTGAATGVILQEDVPEGLEHPQGTQLDNLVGTLGPGEIRRQILRMRAVKPGIVQNEIRVKADDGLETKHSVAVEVIAPELKATLTGPSRRYLERQATYNLELANVGTADATNVELSVQLDRGFTFVKTDFEGQYDASRHAVFWSLPALPVGQSGNVPLTLLPVEEGNRVLRTEATADLGIRTTADSQVAVESLAELTFSISDTADPIEVGGHTIYEIRISNTGSRDDTNVRVALQLPPGLQLAEQGDFTSKGQGVIEFSPRALLKANDEMIYKVKANGVAPGRHLVKAIVTSDQSDLPVTKEESIKVYADR